MTSDHDDIAAIAREVLRLATEATPGPWTQCADRRLVGGAVYAPTPGVNEHPLQVAMATGQAAHYDERASTGEVLIANAALIAAYREAAPALARWVLAQHGAKPANDAEALPSGVSSDFSSTNKAEKSEDPSEPKAHLDPVPLTASCSDLCGPISHDEADAMVTRFIASHFRGRSGGERARITIPADPRRDDDLRLSAYVEQQRERDRAHAELERRARELCEADRARRELMGQRYAGHKVPRDTMLAAESACAEACERVAELLGGKP